MQLGGVSLHRQHRGTTSTTGQPTPSGAAAWSTPVTGEVEADVGTNVPFTGANCNVIAADVADDERRDQRDAGRRDDVH